MIGVARGIGAPSWTGTVWRVVVTRASASAASPSQPTPAQEEMGTCGLSTVDSVPMLDMKALKREYSSKRRLHQQASHLQPKLAQEKMGACGSSVPIPDMEALQKEYSSTPASDKEPSEAGSPVCLHRDAAHEAPFGFLSLQPTNERAELPTETSSCPALGTTETLERSTWKHNC